MKKAVAAMVEDFLEWLTKQSNPSGEVPDPLGLADDSDFSRAAATECLRELEKLGKLTLSQAGGRIILARIAGIRKPEPDVPPESPAVAEKVPAPALSAVESEPDESVRKKVVALIDFDNLLMLYSGGRKENLDLARIFRAIRDYARRLGSLERIEIHLTTRSAHFHHAVHVGYELEMTNVVVPPSPEAADEEIVNTVRFGLMCPEVKYFVVATNDTGLMAICRKAKEAGRRVHVITSVPPAEILTESSTKTVRLETLLNELLPETGAEAGRQPTIQNRYTFAAIKVKNGGTLDAHDEQFVGDCLQAAKAAFSGGYQMPFPWLANAVWEQVEKNWRWRGFGRRDCRYALTALVKAEGTIRCKVTDNGQRSVKVYFME